MALDVTRIKTGRLFDELAHLWPLVSQPEEYREEAGHWRQVLREKLGPGRHQILELGVGGGHNLSHLTDEFDATAVDISEKMLAHSIRLNPDVEHHQGDMRSVRLGRTFQAVLIHDAVSCMLTERDLLAAFKTAAEHLRSGGVLIVSPDFYADTFSGPVFDHGTHTIGDTELTYFEYTYDPNPRDTTIETVMFYLIREKGRLQIEHDRFVCGLFLLNTWSGLMAEAGFQFEKRSFRLRGMEREYVLLVGVKDQG
jgi:SAM-dependent methyltransferase